MMIAFHFKMELHLTLGFASIDNVWLSQVKFEQGLEMLKIFKDHASKTCILDDFGFYESRQKTMQEKKAKQQQSHKQARYVIFMIDMFHIVAQISVDLAGMYSSGLQVILVYELQPPIVHLGLGQARMRSPML